MPELKHFDPETADDAYFKARHHYLNLRRQEEMPEDPPRSLEFSITNAKSQKLFEKELFWFWHLWEGQSIIAELFISVSLYDDNRHLLWSGLEILAPYRRKGYTKLLLPKIVDVADEHMRTLLLFHTSSRIPAGAAFAERLGASKGSEEHTNQLTLAELDRSLLETWINKAKTTARDFELGFWTSYPEEEITAIAKMMEVMNTAPRDNLDIEDWKVEPDELRQDEAYNKAHSIESWTIYARHKLSGELAGYTQTFWNPENPENLTQGATGVISKYRGHGLGKWLKAAMIQKVLAERPVVKRIRTGNADSNAPMLAINNALGFKPYSAETVWQLEVETLKTYLTTRSTLL